MRRSSSNDINDYIAQGVDAIVAVPDDSAGICVAVQNAKDQGIPFYTIDRVAIRLRDQHDRAQRQLPGRSAVG